MKTIAAIFLSGLVGLFIGGGVGYSSGSSNGKTAGALNGICAVADAAVATKVLPSDQAEKIGSTQAQTIKMSAQKAQESIKYSPEDDVCRRIVKGIAQATK